MVGGLHRRPPGRGLLPVSSRERAIAEARRLRRCGGRCPREPYRAETDCGNGRVIRLHLDHRGRRPGLPARWEGRPHPRDGYDRDGQPISKEIVHALPAWTRSAPAPPTSQGSFAANGHRIAALAARHRLGQGRGQRARRERPSVMATIRDIAVSMLRLAGITPDNPHHSRDQPQPRPCHGRNTAIGQRLFDSADLAQNPAAHPNSQPSHQAEHTSES